MNFSAVVYLAPAAVELTLVFLSIMDGGGTSTPLWEPFQNREFEVELGGNEKVAVIELLLELS